MVKCNSKRGQNQLRYFTLVEKNLQQIVGTPKIMFAKRVLLFVVLVAGGARSVAATSAGGLEVTEDDQGFSVVFHDVLLLRHSIDHPLFSLGLGQFDTQENVGNWAINDTLTNRIELDQWEFSECELRILIFYLYS